MLYIVIIEFYKKRPLCIVCTVFLSLLLILSKADITSRIVALVFAIILLILSFILYRKTKSPVLSMVFISVIIASSISIFYFDIYYNGALKYTDEPIEIEAVALENTSYTTYSSSYNMIIDKIDDINVNYKAKLHIDYPCDLNYNERFIMKVTLQELEDEVYGFPIKSYNISKGYVLSAASFDEGIAVYENNDFSIRKFLYECNKFCSNILRSHLNKETFDFVNAILLGNQDELPASLKRDLRYLGLSHVISVSGMHFSILMGAVAAMLRFFKTDKRIINILIIIFSFSFMGLTGFSPSVTRSAFMFIIYSFSFFARRIGDSPTILFFSVSLICLFNPNAILDVGLLMSFSATLGLLTLGISSEHFINSKIKAKNVFIKLIKGIISAFIATVCAVLFTLPFTWSFGMISIVSPITNVICTIPIAIILALSPLIIIFTKIPPLVYMVKIIVMFMYDILDGIINYFTEFDNLAVSLNYDFVKYVFLILIIGVIIVTVIKRVNKNPLIYFVPIIISVITFSIFLYNHNSFESEIVRINYVTYKKNDALIIKNGTRAMICDISDGSYGVTRIANNILADIYCVLNIDTYMLTHYHQRHISTLYTLSQYTYIKNLIIPEPITDTDKSVMNTLMEFADANGYRVTVYPKGTEITILLFNDIYIGVMEYTKLSRSSHPVISLSVNTKTQKAVYFGSSLFESKNIEYITRQITNADIIIFGQHGPILKQPIEITDDMKYLQHVIYASDEIKQAVNNIDIDYTIHNEEHYYSEVAFYVH